MSAPVQDRPGAVVAATIDRVTAGMSPETRNLVISKAAQVVARRRLIQECPTPADLAAKFDPTYVRTEAGELISARIVEAMTSYDGRLTVSQPPQTGKALALNTPIATPSGWTTMGELRIGDEVFDRYGEPCKVTGLSPIWTDHPCYTVTTGDGDSIVADAEHLWVARLDRRNPERLYTTETLARPRLKAAQIEGPAGLNLPNADLPMDPYVLGAWLGDGHSGQAAITSADPEILDRIRDAGFDVTPMSGPLHWYLGIRCGRGRKGMRRGQRGQFAQILDELDVLNSKHIPAIYMRGSEKQRLALLQGLIDSDGYVDPRGGGQVEFCATNRRLAEQVQELVFTLGAKATIREGRATIDGRDCGPKYRVGFLRSEAAYLPRKAVHCKDSSVARTRYVRATPTEPVPVRCITVDSPTRTFLAGKSLLPTHNSLTLRWACVWLLLRDPDTRIVFASYAAALARTSGRIVRALVDTFGGPYGLRLDRAHADAADWQLDGHLGGLYSVGTAGSLTGRACSAMIIDDPHPSMQAADSPTQRGAVLEWWSSVARTRLAPGAPVVGVATRWHHLDLLSKFIADGWPSVNIPALADGLVPDALNRPVGEYLVTPRGTTPDDWRKTRKESGERTWAGLHQGSPSPVEGGVFKTAWFDTWRVAEAPEGCLPPVVVVDPADGGRDEAGVILAAKHATSGRVYILDDFSGSMTVARWARLALLICARRGATAVAYEKSLSQLPVRLKEAWATLHQQATALRKAGDDLDAAHARLSRSDDSDEAGEQTALALAEVAGDVDAILAMGMSGPSVKAITPRGSKTHRMMLVAPAFETGRAVMVGAHAQAEWQLSTWQAGQDSPDRADAIVHAVALLSGMTTASPVGRADGRIPTHSTSLRSRAGSRITRSAGR